MNEARQKEKDKYLNLLKERPTYGSTFHGQSAVELVEKYIRPLLDGRFHSACVVDFGCGGNEFIKKLNTAFGGWLGYHDTGLRGIGVDFVNPKADLIHPMHKVPINDSAADVITAFDALEHLLPEEVEEVLAEMARVGKPGGMFVFSISHKPSVITSLGENLHPTVETGEWWMEKIGEHAKNVSKDNKYIVGRWKK